MNSIHQLVVEALEERRKESFGCFVHNAAAAELVEHGSEAVSAIESEVLACAARDCSVIPSGLGSVMVSYSHLVRRLNAADRCVAFLHRLPQLIRQSNLACVCSAWRVNDPDTDDLPESLRSYLEGFLTTGTEAERREAERILKWYGIDHAA